MYKGRTLILNNLLAILFDFTTTVFINVNKDTESDKKEITALTGVDYEFIASYVQNQSTRKQRKSMFVKVLKGGEIGDVKWEKLCQKEDFTATAARSEVNKAATENNFVVEGGTILAWSNDLLQAHIRDAFKEGGKLELLYARSEKEVIVLKHTRADKPKSGNFSVVGSVCGGLTKALFTNNWAGCYSEGKEPLYEVVETISYVVRKHMVSSAKRRKLLAQRAVSATSCARRELRESTTGAASEHDGNCERARRELRASAIGVASIKTGAVTGAASEDGGFERV